ncbi:MAG: Ig-like domain-containing protein [Gemmatimonadetes bacterium]|nr:Ig-like domain-containing protein [Gemmatimonadota bacterium]
MKILPSLGSLTGAGKWITVTVTTLAAIIGLLVNARNLGLTPWLGLGSVSFADLAARRVMLAPGLDTLTAIGDTVQLAATVTDEHGATLAGATIGWTTDDSAVATVDSSGAVLARGPGTATITASVRERMGRARVTVWQRVRSVAIAHDTLVRLPEGTTVQLVARALDARGRGVTGRAIHWESADTTIVAISPTGSARAGAPGRTLLTAATDGYSASIPAEVSLTAGSVRLLSGTDQRAPAGRRLSQAVTLQVLSPGGRPVPDAVVSFATDYSQGKAEPDAATTDRNGRARVSWLLGPQAGRQHLLITIAGIDSTLVVTAEADPVPANTRVQLLGEAPRGPIGMALSAPVGIRVTDSSGAAAADVPVTWTTADGGTIEGLASRTDSLGETWARWTLGRRAGPQRARVQVGNPRTIAPFAVTATALAGTAAAVAIESGAGQEAAVGSTLKRPIVARLTDRDGNVAAGARLRILAVTGSVQETLLVADQQGRVPLRWTLGRQAGAQWLELRASNDSPVRVSARARPLEPANIEPTGTPASAPPGRALPKPVVFTVTDGYGNAISDVQVVFSSSAGGVTPTRVMTDERGRATARWTLGAAPGDQTLTAAVRGTTVRTAVTVRVVRGPAKK